MTYNILGGGLARERFILQVLKAEQPDVILFQEVTQASVVRGFAQALDMNLFFAEGNTQRHLALLTQFPIVSQQSYHPFPPVCTTILEAAIECAPHKRLHLFGVHLVPHPAVFLEWWRVWEIKVVLRRAMECRESLCLIAGDFNAVAPGDRVVVKSMPTFLKMILALQGGRIFRRVVEETLSASFVDCYRLLHPEGDGFTLPTPVPTIRLDYVFANEVLRACLKKCYVVHRPVAVNQASDHYPVVAEFVV